MQTDINRSYPAKLATKTANMIRRTAGKTDYLNILTEFHSQNQELRKLHANLDLFFSALLGSNCPILLFFKAELFPIPALNSLKLV